MISPAYTAPTSSSRAPDILGALARWLVGGLFIYMGLNKALHPVDFLKLVHQYELVSTPFLLNAIGAALPWFEVFCGLLLVAGIAVRGSALIMVVMLVPFTLVVLKRALAISAVPVAAEPIVFGTAQLTTSGVFSCRAQPVFVFIHGSLRVEVGDVSGKVDGRCRDAKAERPLPPSPFRGGAHLKKKLRCFSLIGISSLSITCNMSSQTFRFSLNAWLRSR